MGGWLFPEIYQNKQQNPDDVYEVPENGGGGYAVFAGGVVVGDEGAT